MHIPPSRAINCYKVRSLRGNVELNFGAEFFLLDPNNGGHKKSICKVPPGKYYSWYSGINQSAKYAVAESDTGEKLPIMLKFVTIVKLGFVKQKKFWEEGFSSPEAFEAFWKKTYGKFNPDELVARIEFDVLKTHIVYRDR